MPVGKLFARSFQAAGMHSFLIHLPYYGKRNADGHDPKPDQLFTLIRQAIADARRARDAIAVLPHVDARHMPCKEPAWAASSWPPQPAWTAPSSPCSSCWPAATCTTCSSAASARWPRLAASWQQAGITDAQLKQLLWQIEPTRVAHRLDPQRTWLFSAEQDQVVPIANADALAKAAHLPRPTTSASPATTTR